MKNLSPKAIKWILAGIVIVLVIVLVLWNVTGQEITVQLEWDYYPVYGSSDVSHLELYWEKWENDTTLTTSEIISPISIYDSAYVLVLQTEYIHKFKMTAVDSANNISGFSNEAICDLIKPVSILNVRIKR